MQQRFRIFGYILLVLGIIGVITTIAALIFISCIAHGMSEVSPELGISFGLLGFIAILASLDSVLYVFAGAGLIKRRPWARTATIIASILSLPGVPFWTALGVYGLWLMFSADGMKSWEAYIRGDDSLTV